MFGGVCAIKTPSGSGFLQVPQVPETGQVGGLPIELEHFPVPSADDQERGAAHPSKVLSGKVRTASTGHHGGHRFRAGRGGG